MEALVLLIKQMYYWLGSTGIAPCTCRAVGGQYWDIPLLYVSRPGWEPLLSAFHHGASWDTVHSHGTIIERVVGRQRADCCWFSGSIHTGRLLPAVLTVVTLSVGYWQINLKSQPAKFSKAKSDFQSLQN